MENRGWVHDPTKESEEYIRGVNEFIEFAFKNSEENGKILCPCIKCANYDSHCRSSVYEHLTDPRRGFLRRYTEWIFHGERPTNSTGTTNQHYEMEHDMDGLLRDAFAMPTLEETISSEAERNPEVGENVKFYKLVKENEQVLYPNCKKYSKLSFMVHLYHLKCLHGWSDKSFSMLLDLLRDALPEGNVLPESYYETKKMISGLGLGYEKIHACPNDCILYWDKHIKDQVCPKCGTSRWKTTNEDVQTTGKETSEKRKNLPAKILRWFPLKPRLQRLFMSSKISESMRWHHDGRVNDGSLRHPADSLAWKEFDSRYKTFSSDARNVRLGVASDGFNPFKTMSITHSTWPVILIPYNLPPWMCMKQSFFMLSLLIPGPKGPGNNIDVYLQPLVKELQELWFDGIETFDAYKKETFKLHAAVMWTINDFPAYANLSGWSTKGQYACPCCGIDTSSRWLKHGGKFCYMCHRRWLAPDHKWRLNSKDFDGTRESRGPPKIHDGIQISRQIDEIREDGLENGAEPWKKKSIFFDLPYWEYNVLRHNLDVMHIEKNVCDNIIGTLLNQEGKSKDNYKARADLVDMGIRSTLHPQPSLKSSTMLLPRACYQMSNKDKDAFLSVLGNVKAPDECSSNISRCVHLKQRKIFGLKSYDGHVLMQQLLPVALRGSLPDRVTSVIIELCNFFKQICSKILNVDFLAQLESRIVLTLCQLETIFPPSFFTIMMHLVIHLASEAKVAGPVQYRWMYPIERYGFILLTHHFS
jgi:ssDNA-binding Zn-finger/Zn-ribbon topoisomerase 1